MSPSARPGSVFISYKSEEAPDAAILRDALLKEGFDVWWDDDLQCGQAWAEEIDEAIRNAACIIVLWSERSVASQWVRHEASQAIVRNVYAPCRIGLVQLESPFDRIQATDLIGWEGDHKHGGFRNLFQRVDTLVPAPVALPRRIGLWLRANVATVFASSIALFAIWLLVTIYLAQQADRLEKVYDCSASTELRVELAIERRSNGESLASVCLRRANLHGADLSGANLSEANITRANLGAADLNEANLHGADLSGADLSEANFRGAGLNGANLHRARLTGADLSGADLTEANLKWADLNGANLRRARLTGANLSGAELVLANLNEADLTGADLTGAALHRARLRRARLTGADLTGADLTGASITEANLSEANITRANLNSADLRKANFVRADLTWADLSGADLRGADLTGAGLTGADLTGAVLLDEDLSEQELDRRAYGIVLGDLSGANLILCRYSPDTKWPGNFDPVAAGCVLIKADVPPSYSASPPEAPGPASLAPTARIKRQ